MIPGLRRRHDGDTDTVDLPEPAPAAAPPTVPAPKARPSGYVLVYPGGGLADTTVRGDLHTVTCELRVIRRQLRAGHVHRSAVHVGAVWPVGVTPPAAALAGYTERVEWGVEQDLPPGGPDAERRVRWMTDEAEARTIFEGAFGSPVQTNPVLVRRSVYYGPPTRVDD